MNQSPMSSRVMVVLALFTSAAKLVVGAEEESSHHSSSEESSHHSSSGEGHGSGHDSGHAEPNMFALGGLFDYNTFIVLLAIFGVVILFMEFILQKYERYLHKTGDRFQKQLYEKIVRELMTLGVVSFVLFMLEPVIPKGDIFIFFEFTHYVIFLIAMFIVAQLVLLGAATYSIKHSWDTAAYKTKDQVMEGYTSAIKHCGKFCVSLPCFGVVSLDLFHLTKDHVWIRRAQFHLARSVFIRTHKQSPNFDFSKYAIRVIDNHIVSTANTSIKSWTALILINWFTYGIRSMEGKVDEAISFRACLIVGIVLFFLGIALLVLSMWGMRRVLVKLGASPNNVYGTLDIPIQRWWVTPRTTPQHNRIMQKVSSLGTATPSSNSTNTASGSVSLPGQSSKGSVAAIPVGAGVTSGDVFSVEGETVFSGDYQVPDITAKDAFIFNSAVPQRWAIEILMLLNAYYLAFIAAYYVGRSIETPSTYVWLFVLPLPILLVVLAVYRRMLPLYALLSAIVMVDDNEAALVSEESEEADKLRRKVVVKIQKELLNHIKEEGARLAAAGLCDTATSKETCYAKLLLRLWDKNSDGTISPEELEDGLKDLGVKLDFKQQREFMRLADPDRSGSIDLHELADLLHDIDTARCQVVDGAPMSSVASLQSDPEVNYDGEEDRIDRVLTKRLTERQLTSNKSLNPTV